MNKKIKIGKLFELFEKYGKESLGVEVLTPFGYKKINWCEITERNSEVYRTTLANGLYVESSYKHQLKKTDSDFTKISDLKVGDSITTEIGDSVINDIYNTGKIEDLYDIEVDEVHQYYSNKILSHNSTAAVDTLLFLFFGETTKSDNYGEIFNLFTKSDVVDVKGSITIEGDEYVIQRKIKRVLKKDGVEYTYTGELNFYQAIPNGGYRTLNGDEAKNTKSVIESYVGKKEDFLLTILTTADNLFNIITTKPTERGLLLTRYIGLDYFKAKSDKCKKIYDEWKGKSKLSKYSKSELLTLNESKESEIISIKKLVDGFKNRKNETEKEIFEIQKRIEDTEKRKIVIDTELYKINEDDINVEIKKITERIQEKNTQYQTELAQAIVPEIQFDIDLYNKLKNELSLLKDKRSELKASIDIKNNNIENLLNSEICSGCGRKLDGVDNKSQIDVIKKEIDKLILESQETQTAITTLETRIAKAENIKEQWASYDKNTVIYERTKIDLDRYQLELVSKETTLARYIQNKTSVEINKELDTKISVDRRLKIDRENTLNSIKLEIATNEKQIEVLEKNIVDNLAIIEELKKDELPDKVFRTYIDIYGKKGISKMVLASMIPIMNYYLQSLMSDSCEFVLVLKMDDDSNVNFWMQDNLTGVLKPLKSGSGYEKTLSALALRSVLAKVCSLPKPNICVFDEPFSGVAESNMDKVGIFFEKLKTYFSKIWIISHDDYVNSWCDKTITIEKIDNISRVQNG
jgi:DNA repair exonuclease SbcCD ATPase subunit